MCRTICYWFVKIIVEFCMQIRNTEVNNKILLNQNMLWAEYNRILFFPNEKIRVEIQITKGYKKKEH